MDQALVTIEQGTLSGTILSCVILSFLKKESNDCKYYSFLGIPYAKPPLDDLRFKAPEAPEKWQGVLNATEEGSGCVRRDWITQRNTGTEDCLKLNVYTRVLPNENSTQLKPVMVWIYGGAFVSGSNSKIIYGPEFLVAKDVVVVAINYRIGLLGFLSLQNESLGVPGNAGLKDQVMALKWVQKNIASFGGDPNQVTIFGQSAGGASVHYLVLSPLSQGLFHRGIILSGSSLSDWALQMTNATHEIGKAIGQNDVDDEEVLYDFLMEQSSEDLLNVQLKVMAQTVVNVHKPFTPTVEKESSNAFITDLPINLLRAGKFNDVPVIHGYTSDEGMTIRVDYSIDQVLNMDWGLFIPEHLGYPLGSNELDVLSQKVKDFYLDGEEPTPDDMRKIYAPITDTSFTYGISLGVRFQSNFSEQNVYLYRFGLTTDLNLIRTLGNFTDPGVCHADDLGYIFKNLLTPTIEEGSTEALYINQMTTLWTNFAKYADPTAQDEDGVLGGLQWDPVTPEKFNILKINEQLVCDDEWPEEERYLFWRKLHEDSPNGKNYVY